MTVGQNFVRVLNLEGWAILTDFDCLGCQKDPLYVYMYYIDEQMPF